MLQIQKIMSGAAFVFALSASPLLAQTQQTEPVQQGSQEKIEVSDAELSKFADAFKQIQVVANQQQQKMVKTVEDEGLDVQRFNEIHTASMDKSKEMDATPEEIKKHEAITTKLDTMQNDFEDTIKKIVENQDISYERFEQVQMALQTDTDLQQRLQKMIQG